MPDPNDNNVASSSRTDKPKDVRKFFVCIDNLKAETHKPQQQLEVVWLLGKAGVYVVPRHITILDSQSGRGRSAYVNFEDKVDCELCVSKLTQYTSSRDFSNLVETGQSFRIFTTNYVDAAASDQAKRPIKYVRGQQILSADWYPRSLFVDFSFYKGRDDIENRSSQLSNCVRINTCALLNSDGGVAVIGVREDGMTAVSL